MKTCSLPIKRPDGSVTVRPLRSAPVWQDRDFDGQKNGERGASAIEDSRTTRARILRDIAILAVLALAIVAGSAVLISVMWRDIAIADSSARIVEAEEAAKARIAEARNQADSSGRFDHDPTLFIVAGVVSAFVVLLLARPTIIVGR